MTEVTGNNELVRRPFETWAPTGDGMFDVLDRDVHWTIVGAHPFGQTFTGRAAFVKSAPDLIALRVASPMVSTVRQSVADGHTLVVRWDGIA